MSRRPCGVTGCDRPTDAFVCRPCGRDLEQRLDGTLWLLDELEVVLTRQSVYGDRHSSRGTTRPLVFDDRASQRLRDLDRALASACRAARAAPVAINGPHAMRHRTRSLAAALAPYVDKLRYVDQAGTLVDELKLAYDRATSTVDRPADRWYAGPCWTPLCGRDLYADVGRPVATCDPKRGGCGATYDVQTRRDYLLREADDQLANAVTIARAVSWLGADPLTPARVRQWATRGRLTARAYDRCPTHLHDHVPPAGCRACSPRYRIGDARDLLASDTNRKVRAT